MSLNDLTIQIYDTIKDDATFQTLTGATATDPRLYYAFPWEQHGISRGKPSYVTYYVGAAGGVPVDGVDTAQIPDQTIIFDIWSKSPDQARLVDERLMNILHSKKFETSDYLAVYLKLDGRNEMGEENIAGAGTHINLRYTLGPVVKVGGGFYSYT